MTSRPRTAAGRLAVAVIAVACLTGTAACGDSASSKPREPPAHTVVVPARSADRTPAAAAGGACQLLDFYAVEHLLGVEFDVAAAAQREATTTCVLQRSGASYPDLTLAVTPAATTPAAFRTGVAPAGSTELTGVGQAAYQLLRPAAGTDPAGPGPTVEVGWLTRTNQLMLVRYRLPPAAGQAEIDGVRPRVVELARFLDPS